MSQLIRKYLYILSSLLVALGSSPFLWYIDEGQFKDYTSFYQYITTDALTECYSNNEEIAFVVFVFFCSIGLYHLLKLIPFLKTKEYLRVLISGIVIFSLYIVLYMFFFVFQGTLKVIFLKF